jgi:hypothetical protein
VPPKPTRCPVHRSAQIGCDPHFYNTTMEGRRRKIMEANFHIPTLDIIGCKPHFSGSINAEPRYCSLPPSSSLYQPPVNRSLAAFVPCAPNAHDNRTSHGRKGCLCMSYYDSSWPRILLSPNSPHPVDHFSSKDIWGFG